MPDHTLFRKRLSLRGILILGRFISERLYKLIGENLNVSSLIAFEGIGGFLLFDGLDWYLGPIFIAIIILFGDDNGGVCISPEDSLIPHEIVIDEFSR
jgi:hypothetical protein